MSYFTAAFERYRRYATTHPAGFLILLIICAVILGYTYYDHVLLHGIGYLAGIALCILTTDVVVDAKPAMKLSFTIKHSAGRELTVVLACTIVGVIFLCIRFFGDWEHLPGLVKLFLIPLIIFTFPIALALIFLFIYKYRLRDLGINLNYWYLPLFLHIIWGGLTLLTAADKIHFASIYTEYGPIGFIASGILGAALSEEFSRMLLQTRIAAVTKNMCIGLFVGSLIWSGMHIPTSYHDSPEQFTLLSATLGTVFLMPLGFFWGYLTYRTHSLIPALLMHGFNLWGLQNF